jgi:DNA-binding MarR family transcriptional regulator
VDLESHAHKLIAGLVRVAVMAPIDSDGADGNGGAPRRGSPIQRQALLLLARRGRDYRLNELAAELGTSVSAVMAALSPLIGDGLVEMRPAPSYAARDMRVAITAQGLTQTPAPASWASDVLGEVERLDEPTQQRLLRQVTTEISALQQEGQIPVTRMCLSCRFFEGNRHPGTNAPHHCWFVDAPFGYRELRLHCPDHIPSGRPRWITPPPPE